MKEYTRTSSFAETEDNKDKLVNTGISFLSVEKDNQKERKGKRVLSREKIE